MKEKQLHKAFSVFDFFWTLFLRVACFFGLIYALSHFEESPIFITVVVLFLLLGICFIGNELVIIYEDMIVQKTNSLASLFFKRKPKAIAINQIQLAYVQQASKDASSEIGIAILLAFFLTRNNSKMVHSIFFKLKNGDTVQLYTLLDYGKRQEIVALVNSLIT